MVSSIPPLRTAQRYKCVFVSGLHPDTTVEVLSHHIVNVMKYKSSMRVEQLMSVRRAGGYTSFKIFVPVEHFDFLVDVNNWCIGELVVHEFQRQNFHGRRTNHMRRPL